jgi:hypothetical protein
VLGYPCTREDSLKHDEEEIQGLKGRYKQERPRSGGSDYAGEIAAHIKERLVISGARIDTEPH